MARRHVSTEDEIKAYRRISKDLGLKLTHQRLQIFEALMSMKDHPSAEDVLAVVKPKIPSISFDTVYRTLALFERHGLIAKVQYIDDKTRYDSEKRRHCHLICTRCRRIEDFFWPEIDQLRVPDETARWGEIENKYLELRGVCQDCLANDARQQVAVGPYQQRREHHE
jgi:Fur family peroxide stress response transcriptional regulator